MDDLITYLDRKGKLKPLDKEKWLNSISIIQILTIIITICYLYVRN